MKEQSPRSQTQGLTGGQITENAVNITEPTQVPNLKPKELQIVQLVHHAAREDKDVSRRDVAKHLYPEENYQIASIKLRVDLDGANRKLRDFGWRIDHPLHYSQGKVRRIRDRYIITRQDKVLKVQPSQSNKKHEVLTEKGRNPKKRPRRRSSRDSIPTLPPTQDIKLLPRSATIWESPEAREERLRQEEFEGLRQAFVLHFTHSVLSHIKTGTIQEFAKGFTRNPKEVSYGLRPKTITLDLVLGIDPKEDKETKNRKIIEFFSDGYIQTVDKLWGQQPNQVTIPKERLILEKCKELEQKGKDRETVLNIVVGCLGTKIPDRPRSIKAA